jgi:hypothetical protein
MKGAKKFRDNRILISTIRANNTTIINREFFSIKLTIACFLLALSMAIIPAVIN